jgi:hypothetical protein
MVMLGGWLLRMGFRSGEDKAEKTLVCRYVIECKVIKVP